MENWKVYYLAGLLLGGLGAKLWTIGCPWEAGVLASGALYTLLVAAKRTER